MREYPTVDYPTIMEGKIYGEKIRYECLDGSELVCKHPDEVTIFKNFKPFEKYGKMWGLTHLQKYSKWGWLKVSPDCYHWWWFWKLQKQDSNGNWIPGTERGIYFRKPFSWRWDVAGTVIGGVLRHWIWSKGFIGFRWD